jgi:transcriptional regulator GlxA family with amidase domain
MHHESPQPNRSLPHQQLDMLCVWIDAHIQDPIGWVELTSESGLSYQEIQSLFWRCKATTPMTWIRQRRAMASAWQHGGQAEHINNEGEPV